MINNSVALDQFELLELRRDDGGVQTFHARELVTVRPVQVHFLTGGSVPENLALLSRINCLPEAERRRVLDRGVSEGRPYVVTDRLAGFASLREWLESKAAAAPLDQQFYRLFDPEVPEPEEDEDPPRRSIPVGAMALGVMVALLFLGLVVAVFAFHPR